MQWIDRSIVTPLEAQNLALPTKKCLRKLKEIQCSIRFNAQYIINGFQIKYKCLLNRFIEF